MPCTELFSEQADEYRASVLPAGIPTVSVEAGVTFGWARWADRSIGIDRFGASAPGEQAMAGLGITPAAVVAAAESLLGT
jgi:transketolase